MMWENIYDLMLSEKEQKWKYVQHDRIFVKNKHIGVMPAWCSELWVISCDSIKTSPNLPIGRNCLILTPQMIPQEYTLYPQSSG